jgi:hypothetical protein
MARSRRACPERSRGNPGDAYWQMFFEVFQPQTTNQINKVTSSDRSVPDFLPRSAGQGGVCAFL